MNQIDETLVRCALHNVEAVLERFKQEDSPIAQMRSSLDLLDAVAYLRIVLPKETE